MGVLISSSSCFMISSRPGSGLLGSSEGKLPVLVVLRVGKVGFGDLGVSTVGEVVLMVGGRGLGDAGDIMGVELERPSYQMNDSRHDQTAMPATGR